MKKVFVFFAMGAFMFVSCTSDGVIEATQTAKTPKDQIGFSMKVVNSTRSEKKAQVAGHYEFGVFANNGGVVMDDYLVAWGGNALYSVFTSTATTYASSDNYTDAKSQWFYEDLGSTGNKTSYTTPNQDLQILKYWDESTDKTEFWAYMPYGKATFADKKFTFKDLSTFYTDPVNQVATAVTNSLTDDDMEKLNYNEALYTYTKVDKDNYKKDVQLHFKHINAQIKLAFYESIKGYTVKIIDMIPDALASSHSKLTATEGIALTPATEPQTDPDQVQPSDLPKYFDQATVTVSDMETTPKISFSAGNGTDDYLNFASMGMIGENKANMVYSGTSLYALPNTVDGAAAQASETGYTIHVSYELIPNDGSASIFVYDARVWIPADKCQWEAGKCYTYIFNITKGSNGTTNPDEIDPYDPTISDPTDPHYDPQYDPTNPLYDPDLDPELNPDIDPWLDPTDPRVDDDPALNPIVFDGVMITDFDPEDLEKDIL